MPSESISWSSRRSCESRALIAPRRKLSVPKALRPIYLHIDTSWGLDRLSKVRSSSNNRATLTISDVDGDSPVDRTWDCVRFNSIHERWLLPRTFRKNSLKASLPMMWALAFRPDSLTVSCKNLAISSRTRSNFLCFSS